MVGPPNKRQKREQYKSERGEDAKKTQELPKPIPSQITIWTSQSTHSRLQDYILNLL
jgi:hypothetical protein